MKLKPIKWEYCEENTSCVWKVWFSLGYFIIKKYKSIVDYYKIYSCGYEDCHDEDNFLTACNSLEEAKEYIESLILNEIKDWIKD